MHVEVSYLMLTNLGQLIEVVADGVTTMGKLERVKFPRKAEASAKVTLRISGDTVTVDGDKIVHIRRSAELYELHQAGLGLEDLLEAQEKVGSGSGSGVGA